MNPEKNRLRRKNNVDFETASDLLNELITSVKTGLCPHCGAVLVVDTDGDGWTHCPVCFWACGHNPG